VPNTQQHLTHAKQNVEFAQSLDLHSTPYLGWVVVAYFYAALHLVDALLYDKEKIDPSRHELRRNYVREKWYLRGIKDEYFELKDRSEDARYRLLPFTAEKIQREIIPLYRTIETHILGQLPR
jgi:uncharacterized protein (UPF0332 family)